jgi:hypothetical protein
MHRISCLLVGALTAGCVIPPPSEPLAPASPQAPATASAGGWVSDDWASYTNPAMTSADVYLELAIADDGAFHGAWARYLCLTEAYGIWSCGKGSLEGTASGQLHADGTGVIELERLGQSALVWRADESGIAIELPRDWVEDGVLFRSTVKRRGP